MRLDLVQGRVGDLKSPLLVLATTTTALRLTNPQSDAI